MPAALRRPAGAGERRRISPRLHLRNELGFWRAFLARQNPDLMASGEGGSNTDAGARARGSSAGSPSGASWRSTRASRSGGRWRSPAPPPASASRNLHATNDQPPLAVADVLLAAEAASGWAGDAPLIFGGDLNLRPAEDPEVFERLAADFGLASPTTGPKKIDHVLVRGLEVVAAPTQWPPERRELTLDGTALRTLRSRPGRGPLRRTGPAGARELRYSSVGRQSQTRNR